MPTLAIIDGISILMFTNDHPPPHFHVRFAGRRAKFDIATGDMIKGTLDKRTVKKVRLWTVLNRDSLLRAWTRCQSRTTTTN